jgi:tRNA1(Val) A37 N6-methylase TrmN6
VTAGWTVDSPAPGLAVAQPVRGFRYGAEAFWLAGFALEGGVPASAADLGTGSGVIALLLAAAGVDAVGFDVREEWRTGWGLTLAGSTVAGRIRLLAGDVAAPLPGKYGLVTANPPFFARDTGPMAPDPWRAAARTESTAPLRRFVEAGMALLEPGGRMCLVLPREREAEVGPVVRRVRVGARRTLIELRPGFSGEATHEHLREDDARTRGWFGRFRAAAP